MTVTRVEKHNIDQPELSLHKILDRKWELGKYITSTKIIFPGNFT